MRCLRRYWPAAVTLLLFCAPPYLPGGYNLRQAGAVNAYILTHPIKPAFAPLYPLFKVLPLALFAAVFLLGNRARRAFSLYAVLVYTLLALAQSISIGAAGIGVCTSSLLLSVWTAVLWLYESRRPRNDFSAMRPPASRAWVFLPALLAFWEPANPITARPDFNPALLLTSGAGLAFCMLTPAYLALLLYFHPRANAVLLQVTALIGCAYAFGNLYLAFILMPTMWWIGVLHFPLLILSLYALYKEYEAVCTAKRCKPPRTPLLPAL